MPLENSKAKSRVSLDDIMSGVAPKQPPQTPKKEVPPPPPLERRNIRSIPDGDEELEQGNRIYTKPPEKVVAQSNTLIPNLANKPVSEVKQDLFHEDPGSPQQENVNDPSRGLDVNPFDDLPNRSNPAGSFPGSGQFPVETVQGSQSGTPNQVQSVSEVTVEAGSGGFFDSSSVQNPPPVQNNPIFQNSPPVQNNPIFQNPPPVQNNPTFQNPPPVHYGSSSSDSASNNQSFQNPPPVHYGSSSSDSASNNQSFQRRESNPVPASGFSLVQFGTEISKGELARFRGVEGVVYRGAVPFLGMGLARYHYLPKFGSYYCYNAECCQRHGYPNVRAVIPWLLYKTDKRGQVISKEVSFHFLQLGEEDYNTQLRDFAVDQRITSVDFQCIFADEQYQRLILTPLDQCFWKTSKETVAFVHTQYEQVWPKASSSIAKVITEYDYRLMVSDSSERSYGDSQVDLGSYKRK